MHNPLYESRTGGHFCFEEIHMADLLNKYHCLTQLDVPAGPSLLDTVSRTT